jgi:hypothetical protein
MKESVIKRLQLLVNKRMTVDEIEFEYVAKYGPATHRTIMAELARLAQGEVIHRVKQGVYEP